MNPTKQDDELWYVQLYAEKVVIETIPKNKREIYKQQYIFEDFNEVEKCRKHLQLAYFETFQRRPLIKIETIEQYLMELVEIELTISEALSEHPNFDGIDFVDVSANGIQVRGFHKKVKGYCYGSQPTIKYDFSNYKDIIEEFINMWKSSDNEERVNQYSSIIEDGNTYGWD